ncbi:hypothetical protein CHUAL_005012 [Chamberlinius hualienensis]
MDIGGYRNKLTGQIYLNAMTQTETSFLCRRFATASIASWTQTLTPKCNRSQQTNRDEWTQYSKVAYFRGNKIVLPKPYLTAEDQAAILVQKVITIQKYWRGYLARKLYRRMKTDKMKLEEQKLNNMDVETWNVDIYTKLMEGQFCTKKEFDLLHKQLAEWKQEQMVQMMNNVPKWDERGRRVAIRWVVSRPKKWLLPSGREVIVLTPVIIHLQQMKDIYYRLVGEPSSRLEVLKQLYKALSLSDGDDSLISQMIEEIQKLIARELSMVRSKTPVANCLGLRLRLHNLLLRYIFIVHLMQQAQFDDNKRLDDEVMTSRSGRCWSCGRYKNLTSKSRCETCQKIETTTCKSDDDIYTTLLKDLQKRESELNGEYTGPAFSIKKGDVKYLVEKIWLRKSALSGSTVVNQLQLCRWDMKEVWSPWNCILLTKDEAWLHQLVTNNETVNSF